MPTDWDDMALVGRVARAHGNRGEVIVNAETDFLEERFRAGAVVYIKRDDRVERLTVGSARIHQGRPVVAFEGVATIEEAERLASLELRIPPGALQPLPGGTFYRHDLVGCRVETLRGEAVGTVRAVEGTLDGSRLVVEGARGEVQIPLAASICVAVDVVSRRVVIDPPEGLLELNARPDRRGIAP
jgi:16S rRNA processing protein RimM